MSPVYCPNCGAEQADGAVYCGTCGEKLVHGHSSKMKSSSAYSIPTQYSTAGYLHSTPTPLKLLLAILILIGMVLLDWVNNLFIWFRYAVKYGESTRFLLPLIYIDLVYTVIRALLAYGLYKRNNIVRYLTGLFSVFGISVFVLVAFVMRIPMSVSTLIFNVLFQTGYIALILLLFLDPDVKAAF